MSPRAAGLVAMVVLVGWGFMMLMRADHSDHGLPAAIYEAGTFAHLRTPEEAATQVRIPLAAGCRALSCITICPQPATSPSCSGGPCGS